MASTLHVPCTFASCQAKFSNVDAMKKHKLESPLHEYCKVCDLDFDDWGALVQHKMESDKHIACPLCGMEFVTEAAQQYHIEQSHPTDQELTCACGEVFTRAGGLMAHVEKNLCPKIKIEHFQANRARKMMLKQYLADPEAFELSARYDSMFAKVPLVEPSLIDEEVSNAVEALSLAPVASLTQGPDADQDEQEGGSDAETSKSWTRERDAPRSGPFGLPLPDLNKVAPPQNPDSSAPAVSFNRGAIAEPNVDPLDPRSRRFAPQMYKHPLTGKYMCPRAFCGSSFKSLQGFTDHLLSPAAHSEDRVMCPCCLKYFKTTAALVQHCESASVRCQIRKFDDYNQKLDVLTGGLIEVKGVHPDGSLKYETGNIEW